MTEINKTEPEQKVPQQSKIKKIGHHSHNWFRRVFWLVAIFPAILFTAFFGAIYFIDFNQYKPTIEAEFKKRTGQNMDIQGTIEMSVLPFVMTIKQIQIKNPEGFEQPNLAKVAAVELEISLWQLFLDQRVAIQALELEKLELFLVTNSNGKRNWQFFERLAKQSMGHSSGFKKVSLSPEMQSPSTGSDVVQEWALNTLISHNARISWDNQLLNRQFKMTDFDLMAFDVSAVKPFVIMANFDYENSQQQTMFHVKLTTHLQIENRFQKWQLSDWKGILQMRLPDDLNIPEVSLQTQGKTFSADFRQSEILVEKSEISSTKGKIEMSFAWHYGKEPFGKGRFVGENIDVKKWLRHSGQQLPDFVNKWVLTDVGLQFDWVQNSDQLSVDNFALKFDKTTLSGKFWKPLNVDVGNAPLHFDFEIDQLDLDTYQALAQKSQSKGLLPFIGDERAPASDSSKKGHLTNTYLPLALPIDTLRQMNSEGILKVKQLGAWGMQFENVETTLLAHQGEINLAPLDAQLYEGSLTSKLQIDVTGKTPSYQWSGKTRNINLKPFLKDGWQYSKMGGKYDGHFVFKTAGVNGDLLKQNLSGHFNSQINEGHFTGVDLNRLLSGLPSSRNDQTQFSTLTMDGKIAKGRYHIKRFNVESERFSAIGSGQINLVKAFLNGSLHAIYQQPPEGLMTLKGVEVPIELKGKLGSVKWKVQLDKLMDNPDNQEKILNSVEQFLKNLE